MSQFDSAPFEALGPGITCFDLVAVITVAFLDKSMSLMGMARLVAEGRKDFDYRRLARGRRLRDDDRASYFSFDAVTSSTAPKYSQRWSAIGTLPFFHTKS